MFPDRGDFHIENNLFLLERRIKHVPERRI